MPAPTRRTRQAPVVLDGQTLTLAQLESVADGAPCKLHDSVAPQVRASREVVERSVRSGEAVYGVNTGFGHLARIRIDDDKLEELQENLVRSHCAGVGPDLDERTVRALLALRANCLARGHSGLRLETLERILEYLRRRIHPRVPSQGSVGASGDLAPLAHVALTLIGEGEVFHQGRLVRTSTALRREGLKPIRLGAKEGLALINGTQMMTAIGSLALVEAERLALAVDVVGAMSLEASRGSHRAFDRRIHQARRQRGQQTSAANLRRLLRGSAIARSHAGCGRVQDCYSLRCMPQVHGAVRDTLAHVRRVLEIELNASTDNPMVFAAQDELVSGGNFHGHPVSLALDHMAVALCAFGTISERRTDRLLNPATSELPAFLAHDPGLNSGFMIAHVTAAALVSENKVLAHPASVDTIPTSAGQEDHVPMGGHAARKAARILDHVTTVLAVELLSAGQALDLLRPLTSSKPVEAALRTLRRQVPHMKRDRVLEGEMDRARELIRSGALVAAAEKAAGPLR